jgi:hypothetical protein
MYELVDGTLDVDGMVGIAHPASGTSFPPPTPAHITQPPHDSAECGCRFSLDRSA